MNFKSLKVVIFIIACAFILKSCTDEILNSPDDKISRVDEKNVMLSNIELFKKHWIKRLSAIRTDNEIIQNSLASIIAEMSKMNDFKLSKTLLNSTIKIAELTDEESFIRIFSSDNPDVGIKLSSIVCKKCIEDIQIGTYSESLRLENLELRADPEKCSCRWTCFGGTSLGAPGSCTVGPCATGQTRYCCIETSRGCGLFGLGACRGHDTLDCPG